MELEVMQAVAAVAGTLTTNVVLLAWLIFERRDSRELWNIIRDLVSMRIEEMKQEDVTLQ